LNSPVHHLVDADRNPARRNLLGCIESVYNPHHLHAALGDISPAEAEPRAA
jgi:transposase InsO family protein